jgi:8-oxo-dGTP pyrophosphatase MutT (NUDIX family)
MSGAVKDTRYSRLTVIETPTPALRPSGEFVRLSHLRKLCECEQVAAVCYRIRGTDIEFLLVRTRGSRRWTFPKGSAEPGLTHAQAAALEAFEEAGVHGKIEEASFTQYVRHGRKKTGNRTSRSREKEVAVNAHLCQVSRLSRPSEAHRKRTWFSVEDARESLRQGRGKDDGAEFARVIDRAVERIQQQCGGSGLVQYQRQQNRLRSVRPRFDPAQKDGLQEVQFDFEEASSMVHVRRQLAGTRQSSALLVGIPRAEVLPCEVLEFTPLPQKKARALGSGTKNG